MYEYLGAFSFLLSFILFLIAYILKFRLTVVADTVWRQRKRKLISLVIQLLSDGWINMYLLILILLFNISFKQQHELNGCTEINVPHQSGSKRIRLWLYNNV